MLSFPSAHRSIMKRRTRCTHDLALLGARWERGYRWPHYEYFCLPSNGLFCSPFQGLRFQCKGLHT